MVSTRLNQDFEILYHRHFKPKFKLLTEHSYDVNITTKTNSYIEGSFVHISFLPLICDLDYLAWNKELLSLFFVVFAGEKY